MICSAQIQPLPQSGKLTSWMIVTVRLPGSIAPVRDSAKAGETPDPVKRSAPSITEAIRLGNRLRGRKRVSFLVMARPSVPECAASRLGAHRPQEPYPRALRAVYLVFCVDAGRQSRAAIRKADRYSARFAGTHERCKKACAAVHRACATAKQMVRQRSRLSAGGWRERELIGIAAVP